jgi:membrane protein required for colicin V production
MNYLDIIFISILAWAAFRGYMKGFIVQLALLAALFIGIWAAVKFSLPVSVLFEEMMSLEQKTSQVVSFIVIFILVIILMYLLAMFLDKFIDQMALGIFNKIAGIFFSVVKSAFIISIILSLIVKINLYFPVIPSEHIKKSMLFEPISKVAPAIFPFFKFDIITTPDIIDNSTVNT